MSRIRSVHPEQWSDEDFVSLSFPARLLAISIRNECDDKGVFIWKPLTIKMRLFPADNVNVEALLIEMVEANMVRRYEVGGKSYGAVRNFRKFQRPKKPNDVHPIPDELRTYVGLDAAGSEPVENQLPTDGEIEPQMEDGGCKGDPPTPRRGMNGSKPVSKQEVDAAFDRFWAAYPRHETKAKAREKLELILKRHEATADQLASAAASYARRMAAEGRPRDKMAHPTTWLNQKRWEDEAEFAAEQTFTKPEGMTDERWAELREMARQRQMERQN